MPADLEDIRFTLEAVAQLAAPWDLDTAQSVLEPVRNFAESTLVDADRLADQQGCSLQGGRVSMPAAISAAYPQYVELGAHLLSVPEEFGGLDAPALVSLPATEILATGSHAFQMVVSLVNGGCELLSALGTSEQQQRYFEQMASGDCLVTMCLTEPEAGSDLGAIRTTAQRQKDGNWCLEGTKIFISGGDQNLTSQILHFVLARTGKIEDRTAGLSLFVCPAVRENGSRNAIEIVRLEEKLGLHGSPTCQLRFNGADAELIGNEGEGLRAMFVMMNRARLEVALQGTALAGKALSIARSYAAERMQGGQPIARHPDVNRMLMQIEAIVLGTRAMNYRAAAQLENADLATFLTPVCKLFCTEMASRAVDDAIQVLGGYGYLPEFGIEQLWRDCRVTRIYEGANGVLAANFVKRVITQNNGAPAKALIVEIELALQSASPRARPELEHLLKQWQASLETLNASPHKLHGAFAFAQLTGIVYFAACWARLEAHAGKAAEPHRITRLAEFARASLFPEASSLAQAGRALSQTNWLEN